MHPLPEPCVDVVTPIMAASIWGRPSATPAARRPSPATIDAEGCRVKLAGWLTGDRLEADRGQSIREDAVREMIARGMSRADAGI